MAYQALARKWRPKTFADLVGQTHVVRALLNALKEGRLHHAYLLTGTRGVGKTTIARILAKSFNCTNITDGEPCGVCDACQQIDSGRYPDLLEIDAASNTGIDNMRELIENAQYAPTQGCYKMYIIDEVHMLSKSAFNAMLKTLEEPPAHVKFILATTDPQKLPITVLSRCLQFVLKNLNAEQIRARLSFILEQEGVSFEPTALHFITKAAAGSMRDALSLLDQAIALGAGVVKENDVRAMLGVADVSHLFAIIKHIVAQDASAMLQVVAEISALGVGFSYILAELAVLLQKAALLQVAQKSIDAFEVEYPYLEALAKSLSAEQIQLYYQCVIHGRKDLSLAPDEEAGFIMTLLRMLSFTPLAASGVPLNAKLSGSQLQDAPPKTQVVEPAQAVSDVAVLVEQVSEQDAKKSKETQEFTPLEAIGESMQVVSEVVVEPVADKKFESVAESIAKVQAVDTAVIANLAEELAAAEAATLALDTPPWDVAASETTKKVSEQVTEQAAKNSKEKQEFTPLEAIGESMQVVSDVAKPEVVAQAEIIHEVLHLDAAVLPLVPQNWPNILAALDDSLGSTRLFVFNTALLEFQTLTNTLALALPAEKVHLATSARVSRLADILSLAYDCAIRIELKPWQENQGLESVAMRHEVADKAAKDEALAALENDKFAQTLLQELGATWLTSSVELVKKSK